jgi:quercetin dioxygenase-like cupin family protein
MKKSTSRGLRNFKGTLVNVRMSANDNSDNISIIEHKMPFGEAPPLHVHKNQDEVFHILRGQLRFEVGGKTFVAHAGDILVAPKNIPHRFIVESLDGAHCITITKGRDFETMVIEMSSPVQVEFMPAHVEPTKSMIDALVASAARNNIDLLGPPLAA